MIVRESRVLSRIRHPNVVCLLGICTDGDSPMMLMTLATGTLLGALQSDPDMPIGRKLQLASARVRFYLPPAPPFSTSPVQSLTSFSLSLSHRHAVSVPG